MDDLYDGENIAQIVLVTGILAGAAVLSGRAIARAWRPSWQVALAALLLGAAARFLHFALFEGELISLASYGCDTLILLIVGLIAWRVTRAAQMVRQYPWLYVRVGLFRWQKFERESTRGR